MDVASESMRGTQDPPRARGRSPGRVVLWFALPAALAVLVFAVPYVAHFSATHPRVRVFVRAAPLWSPPPAPDYDGFAIPGPGAEGHVGRAAFAPFVAVDWTSASLRFAVCAWCAVGFAVLVHLLSRTGWRDGWMQAATFAFVGSVIGLLLSFDMWIAWGGWGPPLLFESTVVGAVLGFANALWFRGLVAPPRR